MPIRALIFDFDGTILDTETPEYAAWQEVYRAHGVELSPDVWADSIGRGHDTNTFDPYSYLESLVGHTIDQVTIRSQRRVRFLELVETESPRSGVVELLGEAAEAGLALAVASSSNRSWVAGHLERLSLLSYFSVLRCSDDVTHTKPHPELYLSTCAALGVAPAEAIAVEDSLNGLRAARQAGLFAIATPNSVTAALPLEEEAHLRFDSLAGVSLSALLAHANNFASGSV